MPVHGPKSQQFFERAKKVLPTGVNSNFRYWGDQDTPVVADAQAGYVWDFDDKRYIDYRLGFGPIILGHADPMVNQRVTEAIQHGVTFASTQEYEVRTAERMVALCPGVEMVRLTNTGSEATMHALRLARGYTGRDLILKFEGSYHGAYDYMMWSTARADRSKGGDRNHPTPIRHGQGVPAAVRDLVQICPWNDVEVLGEMLQEKGEQIAAIIVEPVMGNVAALMPGPGYFEFLRQQCDQYGIVLIFDEVKTGFRLAPGGAREYYGVIPDLSTYAKALGNGFPIAAVGGRREIMMNFVPGRVFQAGTYAGNVVGTAAADATLEQIQSGIVFEQINRVGGRLIAGLDEILTRYSLPHFLSGTAGMFGIILAEKYPRDWREVLEADWDLYEKIITFMIEAGVMPEPDGFEPWFICAAHTDADADQSLQAFEDGLKQSLE